MSADDLLYRCYVKGTTSETEEPRRSQNWAKARRAWLRVYADRVECGDWVIPYGDVQHAILYDAGCSLLGRVRIVQLTTVSESYQFGINPWARPDLRMALEFETRRVTLGYSPYSIAVRVLLFGYIAYSLWERFGV